MLLNHKEKREGGGPSSKPDTALYYKIKQNTINLKITEQNYRPWDPGNTPLSGCTTGLTDNIFNRGFTSGWPIVLKKQIK
jgi:hypothetical protein